MKIAIIGAGPAGLTAARNLRGHRTVVFEANEWIGGRTRTIRQDGHVIDSGAGWLGSFYSGTLELVAEFGEDLEVLDLASASCLSERGEIIQTPKSAREAISTPLLPAGEKARLAAWALALLVRQPRANLQPDMRFDGIDADTHVTRSIGPRAAERVFAPLVSAVFADLSELSAALLRSWMRAGIGARFFAPANGMDSLWQRVADDLPEVRTSTPVREISIGRSSGVDIATDSGQAERFDGCIVAAPVTRVRDLITGADLPTWFEDVRYAPHFRVYAAIEGDIARADIHPVESQEIATISRGPAGRLWGTVPEGHSAALVGSSGPWTSELLGNGAGRLWGRAKEIDRELFALEDAVKVIPIEWEEAVPVFSPGHYGRVRSFENKPPLVFAGDWLVQPCIEGAVRSGITAARAFGAA